MVWASVTSGSALAAEPGAAVAFTADVAIERSSFASATSLSALHKGVNVNLLEDSKLRWDASVAGNSGFADVAGKKDFRDLFQKLGAGSLRLPGGTASNYYDFDSNKAWSSWAVQSSSRYNRSAAIDWATFWSFHSATGSLSLMNTANVYKSGNPSRTDNWISANVAEHWASYFKTQKVTRSRWELGNEVYASNQTPGLEYPGSKISKGKTYLSRACDTAVAIKKGDSTAKVGLVVYEHESTSGYPVLDQAASFCGLETFDFFIVHDYAPLYPRTATAPSFYQKGVEMSLAYQSLVHTVSDLETYLRKKFPNVAKRPIYVTEYGLLSSGDVNLGQTDWYDKPVALLLLNHYLNLVAQGASGAWYWEAVHAYFRLIDADHLTATKLYDLLSHAFAQHGKLKSIHVSGSQTFDARGPIGSGCLEGEATSKCWHVALASGKTLSKQPLLKVYAALRDQDSKRKLTVTVINFSASAHALNLKLSGFSGADYKTSFEISQWELSGSSWDAAMGTPTTTAFAASNVAGSSRLAQQRIPARSVAIFEIAL